MSDELSFEPPERRKGIGISYGAARGNQYGDPLTIEIVRVDPDGSAALSGIEKGDQVYEVDGIKITSLKGGAENPVDAFGKYLGSRQVGATVIFSLTRESITMHRKVKVE